ncbi:MAG: hypothetical protein AB7S81_01170 [Bdellovibrionales bacterium]
MNTAKALRYEDYKQPPQLTVVRPQGTNATVSIQDQPVWDIASTATIVDGTSGIRPPKGTVYIAKPLNDAAKREFMGQDKPRELFVKTDSGQEFFTSARFLKEGRKTNQLREIWELEMMSPIPPVSLRKQMEATFGNGKKLPTPSAH